MQTAYCPVCGKVTGHKRAVGMGTLIAAMVTLGISLLAIRCNPLRCVACGNKTEWNAMNAPETIAVVIVVGLIIWWYLH
jgi:hypothetical protein